MVQLKQVSYRLKSIRNIQKITKTMKMVSASKFTKAERELQSARAFGYGPRKFYVSSHLQKDALDDEGKRDKQSKEAPSPPQPTEDKKQSEEQSRIIRRIYIAMTSDRGLCGGVHSGLARRIRRTLTDRNAEAQTNKLVCIGDKARSMLRSTHSEHMLLSVKQHEWVNLIGEGPRYHRITALNSSVPNAAVFSMIGRVSPVFKDASTVANAIAESGFPYDMAEIYYNKYHSPVKYEITTLPVFNKYGIEMAPNINAFDDIEEDQLESYAEWTLAALLYYALKQGAASEQSARMSAMDNATKNAADMIRNLSLLYNRTRQAVITRELIEIISGAAALK